MINDKLIKKMAKRHPMTDGQRYVVQKKMDEKFLKERIKVRWQ